MSLVSDALRKARQYATARDIQRHGAAAGAFSPPPRRSRLGLGLLLGAFIALAAAAAGAVFVLWALRDVAAGRDDAATVTQAGAVPAPVAPGPALEQSSRAEPAAQPAEPPPAPREAPSGSAPLQAGEAPTEEARPAESPALPPGGAAGDERTFILHADLGYATLNLDFLVYKPSGGFGRVNGQDVAPGTIVDGFVVEEIGPDFIRLRDSRGPVVLRTR